MLIKLNSNRLLFNLSVKYSYNLIATTLSMKGIRKPHTKIMRILEPAKEGKAAPLKSLIAVRKSTDNMKEDINVNINPAATPTAIAWPQLDFPLLKGIVIFLLKNRVSNKNTTIDNIKRKNSPDDSCGLKLINAQPRKISDNI